LKKVLITGSSGFTGRYLIEFLMRLSDIEIVGVDLSPLDLIRTYQTDVLDLQNTMNIIEKEKPDFIIHLAGINRAEDFRLFYQYNLYPVVNILETAKRQDLSETHILFISSSAVYGRVTGNPVPESAMPAPVNFYGSSKLAMETAILQYFHNFSLNVHIVRPFNLVGPGQSPSFVVPYFAGKIVGFKNVPGPHILKTKSLSGARDFVDVRDAVDAYWRVITSGRKGGIYNVASGRATAIRDLLTMIIEQVGLKEKITIEEGKTQAGEIPIITGDIGKLSQLKWTAKTDIEQTLSDVIAACHV
jgi:nucleoside-diphosphate-sugar epimerase